MGYKDIFNEIDSESSSVKVKDFKEAVHEYATKARVRKDASAELVMLLMKFSEGGVRETEKFIDTDKDIMPAVETTITATLSRLGDVSVMKAIAMVTSFERGMPDKVIISNWKNNPQACLMAAMMSVLEDGVDIPEEDVKLQEEKMKGLGIDEMMELLEQLAKKLNK